MRLQQRVPGLYGCDVKLQRWWWTCGYRKWRRSLLTAVQTIKSGHSICDHRTRRLSLLTAAQSTKPWRRWVCVGSEGEFYVTSSLYDLILMMGMRIEWQDKMHVKFRIKRAERYKCVYVKENRVTVIFVIIVRTKLMIGSMNEYTYRISSMCIWINENIWVKPMNETRSMSTLGYVIYFINEIKNTNLY